MWPATALPRHAGNTGTQRKPSRAVQAVRNGGAAGIQYAEAYQRVFPQVSGVLG
jgi:hypothetical protein